MTVYISGPITGNDDYYEQFMDAYIRLDNLGHSPVSPISIGVELENKLKRKPTWAEYMREDIRELMRCDGIYMMPGWTDSTGSCAEKHIAFIVGIQLVNLP